MQKPFQRRHMAHRNVYNACAGERGFFEATAGGTKALARLESLVADVDRLLVEQETTPMDRGGATQTVRKCRREIRDMLKAVVRVSVFVAAREPAAHIVRVPEVKSDQELMSDAQAILNIVTPFAELYEEEGLPKNVLVDLPAKMALLDLSRKRQTTARGDYTVATVRIRQRLNQTDAAIGVLESILVTSPNADSRLLTMLRLSKRVGHRPKPQTQPDSAPSETNAS